MINLIFYFNFPIFKNIKVLSLLLIKTPNFFLKTIKDPYIIRKTRLSNHRIKTPQVSMQVI